MPLATRSSRWVFYSGVVEFLDFAEVLGIDPEEIMLATLSAMARDRLKAAIRSKVVEVRLDRDVQHGSSGD